MSLPPRGVGVWARSQPIEWLRQWDIIVLPFSRADTRVKAPALKEAGKTVGVYVGVNDALPSNWRRNYAKAKRIQDLYNLDFVQMDPEGGWDGQSAEAIQLANAMAEDARGGRNVSLTSFPLWPHMRRVAEICRGHIWGCPQIYAKETYAREGAAVLNAWVGRWKQAFGDAYVIPGISGWKSNAVVSNEEGYQRYLDAIPPAQGAIAWTVNARTEWMDRRLRAFMPARFPGGTVLLQGMNFLTTPIGMVIGAVILLSIIAWVFL